LFSTLNFPEIQFSDSLLGKNICFDQYIDYSHVKESPLVKRTSYLDVQMKKNLQRAEDPHYVQGAFMNE